MNDIFNQIFLISYAPHGTNASPLPPPRDLIKKVVQECDCPFSVVGQSYIKRIKRKKE